MEELERKFLFKEPTNYLMQLKRRSPNKVKHIEQYFILIENYREMRVRKTTENNIIKYELIIKEGSGGMREEITFSISSSMYNYMKEKSIGYIEKDRLLFELDYGLVAEIDFFNNFIMAEIEFDNGYQYMEFDEFKFKELGLTIDFEEVTNNSDFYNKNIAIEGG
ncbi:MAG: hypothetical protein ACOCRX_07030 [Candidatus Woesearchaeota archaeon]